MLIEPGSDERAIIVGQTGSGKTYMARQLLLDAKRLVVLDPKGMLRSPVEPEEPDDAYEDWRLTEWSDAGAKKLSSGDPIRLRVAAPLDGDWSEVLWAVYRAGNCVLYIDEIYGVVPPGRRPPDALTAIYTRGRELGIGAYGCSQRPTWIPLTLISEAYWFFCFRLMQDADRRRMAEFMGPSVLTPITDRYGFWTYNVFWDQPVYTKQLDVVARTPKRGRERSA